MAEPEGATSRRLSILQADEDTYASATITGHGYGGFVQAQFDGADNEGWLDLTKEQYRWLA